MLQATPLESATLYVSKPLLKNGVISYCRKGRKLYIVQGRERDSKPNPAQAVASYTTTPQYWPGKRKPVW